jgi:hypothetical protein
MGETDPKTAAADTNSNDEYTVAGPLAGPPNPPEIQGEDLDVARDPELTTAAREEAAEEADSEPVGAEPEAERLTSGYGDAHTEQLEAEIAARQAEGATINVTGTGSGGKVTNADRAKALEADDQAKASA